MRRAISLTEIYEEWKNLGEKPRVLRQPLVALMVSEHDCPVVFLGRTFGRGPRSMIVNHPDLMVRGYIPKSSLLPTLKVRREGNALEVLPPRREAAALSF